MNAEVINKIKEKFSGEIIKFHEQSPTRYYILINKGDLLKVVKYIFDDLQARYIIETGLDTSQGIEILYHFSFDKIGIVISIRTLLSQDNPEVESISAIVKGAQWIEREIQDILGVKFLNHPDPRRFILPDDWPEGVYPYRKDNGSE